MDQSEIQTLRAKLTPVYEKSYEWLKDEAVIADFEKLYRLLANRNEIPGLYPGRLDALAVVLGWKVVLKDAPLDR